MDSRMKRRVVLAVRAIVAIVSFVGADFSAAAQDRRDLDLAVVVEAALAAKARQAPPTCPGADAASPAGLTVHDGIVTAADVIKEIGGYAGSAQTTGGLGGRLLVVTTTRDYDPEKHEPPIPGSLRAQLARAQGDKTPAWIVFDPALGPQARIELKRILRVPSDVTIDGSCADITLEAPDTTNTILVYISSGIQNVIITRLAMRKIGYVPELNPDDESALRINGDVDRIAVLHNDLYECGDGCIDITVSHNYPMPRAGRITVAYNFIHDHDKVMLFGTFDCPIGGDQCDREYFDRNRLLAPVLHLTLDGNLFLHTGQRHPRVWGRVTAHIVNNVIAFQGLRRPNGALGDAYGIFVSNAARALIEHNLFAAVAPRRNPTLAVWTVVTRGAEKMPGDVEGFVRLRQNKVIGGAVAADDQPQEVPDPPYTFYALPLEELSFKNAIACLADRAGRTGALAWDARLCAP